MLNNERSTLGEKFFLVADVLLPQGVFPVSEQRAGPAVLYFSDSSRNIATEFETCHP